MTTYDTFDFLENEIYEICMFCYPIPVEKTMGIAKHHILTCHVLHGRAPPDTRRSAATTDASAEAGSAESERSRAGEGKRRGDRSRSRSHDKYGWCLVTVDA